MFYLCENIEKWIINNQSKADLHADYLNDIFTLNLKKRLLVLS